MRLLGYLLIFLFSSPGLSHTYDLVSSLQTREPGQSSWLMSSFSIHFHVHPLDCNRVVTKDTRHLPHPRLKTWSSHLFTLIISCHPTCFCSRSQAKGLRSCFTKDSLLLGNLSSELLQPGSSSLLYFCHTMIITGNEYMTLDIVTDWPPEDYWLASYWA